ncbi:MAG: hypothetical protein HYS74_00190 [Parcubacteria group bacterium]|nr:hypothetical protein [Parcubacteria group bacterium]
MDLSDSDVGEALFFTKIENFCYHVIVFALRILGLNAAKEKLEIVIGAASPQILDFFAGGLPRRRRRRNGFALIQE